MCVTPLEATAGVVLALALLGPASSLCHAGDLGVSLGVASDYVVHGLTRSRGNAVAQADVSYTTDTRWRLGLAASTLDLNPGPGPNRQVGLYLSRSYSVGQDWALGLELAHYEFGPDTNVVDYDYTELTGTASFRERVGLSLGYSPNYSLVSRLGLARRRNALNYSGWFRQPIGPALSVVGGVGYYDLSDLYATGYAYWSVGAEFGWQRLSLALTYVDTDRQALALFGSQYAGSRILASAAVRLR